MRDSGNVAVDAESAQSRFEGIKKIEGGLRSLRGIRFIVAGDARLKVGRHRRVVELMDFSHWIHFGSGSHNRMSTPGRLPKKSGRKPRNLSAY